MDIDKPLDDLIASNRKVSGAQRTKPRSSNGRGGAGAGGGERGGRRNEPYARPPPRSTEDTWVHDAFDGGRGGARGRGNARVVSGGRDVMTNVAGTGVGFTGVSPRIVVENLHWEVTPADLKNIFSQAGTLVQGPDLRYDRSGRSTGTATMEYASYQQAKIAINKFDGAMTKGQTISIRLLPPATPRGAGAPGGRGGAAGQTSTQNLLSRIGKSADLSTRLAPPPGAAVGGAGATRGGGGRGGSVRGRERGGGGRGGARKGPANAGDLDKELDSFMTSDKNGGEDVAMA